MGISHRAPLRHGKRIGALGQFVRHVRLPCFGENSSA
jgi:hypothetical protein